MGKVFYTERDIEDMAARGERSLDVCEDVVLTDLAYESARKLGVKLVQQNDNPPGAPVRPYINKTVSPSVAAARAAPTMRIDEVKQRVKTAVMAQLGDQVDEALLDRIIEKALSDLGVH